MCRTVSTYGEVVRAADALVAELTAHERAAVLGGTAIDLYGLGVTAQAGGPG